MIKMKESQLIAMLNIVKENPNVDIWELMSASDIRVLKEKTINLDELTSKDTLSLHDTERTFSRTIVKNVPPKGKRYHPAQKEFYQ